MSNISILKNKVLEYLNNDGNITNVNAVDEKLGIKITANYYNDVLFEFYIRNKGDMTTTKAECIFDLNDPEADEEVVARHIVGNKDGVLCTAYDGKCVIQKVVNYNGEEDNKAAGILVNEIIGLIEIINSGLNQFKHSKVKKTESSVVQPEPQIQDVVEEQEEAVTDDTSESNEPEIAEKAPVTKTETNKQVSPQASSRPRRQKRQRSSAASIINSIQDNNTNPSVSVEETNVPVSDNVTEPVVNAVTDSPKSVQQKKASSRIQNSDSFAISSETKKQVDALYVEMNEIFDQKKQDADERERLLDEYADSLTAKEAELDEQKQANIRELTLLKAEQENEYKKKTAELEAQYKEKEEKLLEKAAELDSVSEKLEVDKKTIDFTWKKIDVEKASLEEKTKALEEKTAILQKLKKETTSQSDNNQSKASDLAKIEALSKEIDALNDELDSLDEENEKLTKENEDIVKLNDELSKDNDNLNKNYRGLQSKYDKLLASKDSQSAVVDNSKEIEEKESEIRQLKAEIESIKRDNQVLQDSAGASDDESLEIIKNLRSEVETLSGKNKELETNFEDAKNKYIALESELKVANDKLLNIPESGGTGSEPEDLAAKAQKVKSDLAKLGINVEFVAGAGSEDMVLHGNANNSLIVVNVKANVLYIEKKVKKVKSYLVPIENWNQEDIRITYGVHENNVICKYTYDDISTAITKSFEKFNAII